MQSRLSPPRLPVQIKGLPAASRIAAPGNQPVFDGTIASACELMGISLGKFIEMARWARGTDPRVAQFLDAWDALGASDRQAQRAADSVCERVGLGPVELLGFAADAGCRVSMYTAQIIAAVSLPRVVAKTVERALTDEGAVDRTLLHKATGFLPTPKGSQTAIAKMQNAQARVTEAAQPVEVPCPEETIRRLTDRFNQAHALPSTSRIALRNTPAEETASAPLECPGSEELDGPHS